MKMLSAILFTLLGIVPAGQMSLKPLQQRDSVLVADQFEYAFELNNVEDGTTIQVSPGKEIFPSDTLVLVRDWQQDTLKTDRRKGLRNIRLSLVFAPFEEGIWNLPAVLAVRTNPDGAVDTLEFDSQELEVMTMPVDTATFQIKDIKGPVTYPLTFKEILPWLAGALLLAALVFLAVLLIRKFAVKKGGENVQPDPAYIVALRALDKYRSEKYWAPDKQKAFYSGITDALKYYIEDRFRVDAPEMTSAELMDALKEEKELPKDLWEGLRELMETADFVKFAKHAAPDSQNAKALPFAVGFITSTYQAAETENKEEES